MKDFLENINILTILSIILGFVSTYISYYFFNRKRQADKRLADLLRKDDSFKIILSKEIEKIKSLNTSSLDEYKSKIDISSNIELKSIEIKKMLLEKELQLIKLEMLKDKFSELAKTLKSSDQKEILEIINQLTKESQTNYINNILTQSGSTENIQLFNDK
ncbi:hypothetical protein [Sediminibacterium sp.]|uniref:hypothetical protein n=1 Tax=Sediminibacterium sp. TaxID=1917865 RepID=UPI003F6E7307